MRTGWTPEYILGHTLSWIRELVRALDERFMEDARMVEYLRRVDNKTLKAMNFRAAKDGKPAAPSLADVKRFFGGRLKMQ